MSSIPVPRWWQRIENGVLVAAFLVAIVLPLVDAIGRPLGGLHIPGNATYLQQLTLWLAFLGGLLAVREGKHLTLSTAEVFGEGTAAGALVRWSPTAVAAAVTAVLAYGSVPGGHGRPRAGRPCSRSGFRVWVSELVMPLALALATLRLVVARLDALARAGRSPLTAVPLVFALGLLPRPLGRAASGRWWRSCWWPRCWAPRCSRPWPASACCCSSPSRPRSRRCRPRSTAWWPRRPCRPSRCSPPAATCSPSRRAAHRLVRFFRALFGWMPGGIAVLVAGVCALFTTFTGGSGITIIALGGLVYPILREDGYSERFSLGLVTAGGSLGLLFPPSLPVILYSVVASVPADQLYLAGLLPGLLLVVLTAVYGIVVGRREQKSTPGVLPAGERWRRPGRPSGSCRCRSSWSACSRAAWPPWSRPRRRPPPTPSSSSAS